MIHYSLPRIFLPRRDDLLRAGALIVLLFAILPNVAHVGHWMLPGAVADRFANDQVAAETHAAHCHGGRNGCSGSSSLGQIRSEDESASLQVPARSLFATNATSRIVPVGELTRRIEKPPDVS